ncbi:MAG: alkaline phosphatase family protein [Candidatus Bathyarchaeia archaeon]
MGVRRILKLIYVVIDGMGDQPIEELGNKTPLEAAETPNMDFLAKNGKTGLMYTVRKGVAPESDVAVISILGYDPFRYSTGRGILEAIGANVTVKDGDLALRCNFATLGRGKQIIDRRAGRDLTTEEAEELSEAVNERVRLESYPVDFEFRNTIGHRAVLVIRSREKPLSSMVTNTDPAYSRMEGLGVAETEAEMILKKCEPMEETEEARISARLVNEFVEKSHIVLDKHYVNKKRVAEGKLKANLILTRDAGHLLPKFFDINKRYNVHFASLTDMPIERGISKLAGMRMAVLPPPSHDLRKDCTLRVKKLLDLLAFHDCFYIHIKGPDEPGHDGKFDLKTYMIAVIDKYFFETLLQGIRLEDYIICVTADHSTPCKLGAHSDDPVPLLISGNKIKGDNVYKFSEKECRRGGLGVLEHGTELMPKLISFLKT